MQKPTGPLKAVPIHPSARSEALDPSMKFDEYAKSRDESLVVDKAGMHAPRFVLKPIKKIALVDVDATSNEVSRNLLAFLLSCHEIVVSDSETMKPEREELADSGAGQQVASTEWFERVADRFGMDAVYEMGHLARQRSRLRAGDAGPFSSWAGMAARR